MMEDTDKINLHDASFIFVVEEKFSVKGRGVFIAGRINLGKVSSGDEVIVSDNMGLIRGKTKVGVEFFCSSKMEDKHTAYEPMLISLLLEDNAMIGKVEVSDYIVMI